MRPVSRPRADKRALYKIKTISDPLFKYSTRATVKQVKTLRSARSRAYVRALAVYITSTTDCLEKTECSWFKDTESFRTLLSRTTFDVTFTNNAPQRVTSDIRTCIFIVPGTVFKNLTFTTR